MTKEKVLDKVRALLAKAESTEHEAEADAFLAGAQRLIAAHAIEMAELEQADPSEIVSDALWIPEPYSNAKARIAWAIDGHVGIYSHLSARIQTRMGGRGRGRWLTRFGTAEALELHEAMFTSLLAQCAARVAKITKATIEADDSIEADRWIERRVNWNTGETTGGHWAKPSTRTVRDEFIVGFALGVSLKLGEANRAHEEETGESVALVLASAAERAKQGNDKGVRKAERKWASRAGTDAGLAADVGHRRIRGQRALSA